MKQWLRRVAWFSGRRVSVVSSKDALPSDRVLYGLLVAALTVYLASALLINVVLDAVMVYDRAGLARSDLAQAFVTISEWARAIGSFAAVASFVLIFIALYREWRNYARWSNALRMKPHLDALKARAKGHEKG